MASRPKKQGEADEVAERQLGLALSFVARVAPVTTTTDDVAEAAGPTVPGAPALAIAPRVAVGPVEIEGQASGPGPTTSLSPSGPLMAMGSGVDLVRPPGATPTPTPVTLPMPVTLPSGAAAQTAPRVPRIFAVGELVRAARLTMEARFTDVRVEGEVSGFKRSGPGHLYFCIKDDHAALDCVMYAREAARLKFQIDDGMAVRVRGRLTIYEGRGRFQMSVVEIEPQGAGVLAVAFEQLKQKLEAAGLFAAARKRPLPFLPRRLGVVTSPQGAVIRDIIRVAHRRFPVSILLAPTAVQGPGAALGIVFALERLARVKDVDVIILARGGGSIEDLWSFNEEPVARAIAACRVPVISAVGHETDFTIADFVADVRAPTPSAAAELAVPVIGDLRAEIAVLSRRAGRGVSVHFRQARLMLERARSRIGDPRRLCDERRQMLDDLGARAHRHLARRLARHRAVLGAAEVALSRAHPHRRIATQRTALADLGQRLATAARRVFQRRRAHFDSLAHKLDALSPRRVLDRGYSLTFGADGHLLTDAAAAAAGDCIRVALKRGEITAIVESKDRS